MDGEEGPVDGVGLSDHINPIHIRLFSACKCRLLLTYGNSLDPYQAQHNVWSGSKLFDMLMEFLKEFFKKNIDLDINQQKKKRHKKNTQHAKS